MSEQEIINGFWKIIGTISLLQLFWWIMIFIVGGSILYFGRYLKDQIRFGKNLKRKIYFLKTSEDKDLQSEKDLLLNIGLLNIEKDVKDISDGIKKLQNFKSNSVYIVGYSEDYDNYKQLIEYAEGKKIPVIIYAEQGEIKKNWGIFNNYIYCDVANTNCRLAVITLNILKII